MVQHWNETRNALSEIADYALTYHSNAVDIRFFNSQYRKLGVQVQRFTIRKELFL
jgi:hypothetical protein